MHTPNHKEEDFFDLLNRPVGVVPKNKNFEAAPLTLGQKVAKRIPSQHKDPERAAGHEKGLALTIDTLNSLIPKTKKQLGIDLALTAIPFGHVAKQGLKFGKKLFKSKKFGNLLKATDDSNKSFGKRFTEAQNSPDPEKALKRMDIEDGLNIDKTKAATSYRTHVAQKAEEFTVGVGPHKTVRDLPAFSANSETAKAGSGRVSYVNDGNHEILQRTSKRLGKNLPDPTKEDVVQHHLSIKLKGSRFLLDDTAGMSFRTRRVPSENVTYFEGVEFASGKRTSGKGGSMGFTLNDLTKDESKQVRISSVKLMNHLISRAPKNSVLILDSKGANSVTREALIVAINTAALRAKRILLNSNDFTRVKTKYDGIGTNRNFAELSDKDFGKVILESLESASKRGKVHGTMKASSAGKGEIDISAMRFELAAAFGIPLSQFDSFMGEVTEEKFEDMVLEQDAPIFE
jgi:hypothetical protein